MKTFIINSQNRTHHFATLLFFAFLMTACSDPRLIPNVVPPVQNTVAMKVMNYCPSNGYSYGDTFVINGSSALQNDVWITDTDRDGIPDATESEGSLISLFHLGYQSAFANGTNYTDLAIYTLGIQATSFVSLAACANPNQDTDHDGLSDCDEALLHTDPLNPDTDGDGIPDGLEVRFGTNPLDPSDATTDVDADGFNNIQEIKMNTPVAVSNNTLTNAAALQYTLTQTATGANPCYEIKISNIPTMAVFNGNLIKVLVTETKIVQGQTPSTNIVSANILVPLDTENKAVIEVDGLTNQTIDGTTTPLVIVPN